MDPLTLLAIFVILGPTAASCVFWFRLGASGFGVALLILIVALVAFHFRSAVIYSIMVLHPIGWMTLPLVFGGVVTAVIVENQGKKGSGDIC